MIGYLESNPWGPRSENDSPSVLLRSSHSNRGQSRGRGDRGAGRDRGYGAKARAESTNLGTSITASDGAALKKLGITDVTAIANQTPGMQFNQYGATITACNLRGVSQNDCSDHQEAPIAAYADDAYIASMGARAGSLFDI